MGYDMRMAIDEAQELPTLPAEVAVSPSKAQKPHWAFTALGVATILGICYWAELVLAVILVAVLLAFILAPLMDLLIRLPLPRGLAAAIVVLMLVSLVAGLVYYSSNQAITFLQDVSKYTTRAGEVIERFRQQVETLDSLNPGRPGNQPGTVRAGTNWTEILTRGFGSFGQTLLAASFVPFLVYFMLTWQHHVRSATVMLFPMQNRHTAYVTLGLISAMIRTFMVGNLLIGLFMAVASTAIFGILHFPFFYFVGFISGFLSLIPYLGVLLAIAAPLFAGVGHIDSADVVLIIVTVVGLHVFSLNVLYPKFLGNRLQLNPLAVTMALLVWGWLWGAMGLVLAIPITAAMKIIFDHVQSLKPYAVWLGE